MPMYQMPSRFLVLVKPRSVRREPNPVCVSARFSWEDHEQFAQLIGYSLSGFGSLSYVSEDTYETARRRYEDEQSETEARLAYLEEALATIRAGLKKIVPAVFAIHPDDLQP